MAKVETVSVILPNLQSNAAVSLTSFLQVHPLVQSTSSQVGSDQVKLSFRRATSSDLLKPFGLQLIALFSLTFAAGLYLGGARFKNETNR